MRNQSARKTSAVVQSIAELMKTRNKPPVLSPMGAVARPGSLIFPDGRAYLDLFSGPIVKRSPARVHRMGLLNRLLGRCCLRKVMTDADAGFDVSVVSYPMKVDLPAWGVVTDAVGRSFSATVAEDGTLELSYQGGLCHSKADWAMSVRRDWAHEADRVGHFYRKARQLAGERTVVAGTLGFGLWDALWMSFDLMQARHLVSIDPNFVQTVFDHWMRYHIAAVRAMMDAGISTIFYNEHSDGFPVDGDTAEWLDPLLGEYLRELTAIVRFRGGCTFFSCNANEMLETDYPIRWGFDGIGPMLFRDGEDLVAAAQSLSEDLFLVGSVSIPSANESVATPGGPSAHIIRSALRTALADPIDAARRAGCLNPTA